MSTAQIVTMCISGGAVGGLVLWARLTRASRIIKTIFREELGEHEELPRQQLT